MDLRANIARLRNAADMTQESLASYLDVSRQTVSKWESGKAIPELEKLVKMCDLFGCKLDDIVDRGDDVSVTGCAAKIEGSREREPVQSGFQPYAFQGDELAGSMSLEGSPDAAGGDYHARLRSLAWRLATGLTACITGVGFLLLFSGSTFINYEASQLLSVTLLIAGIAIGACLIVPAVMGYSLNIRQNPLITNTYSAEDRYIAKRRFVASAIASASLVVLGIIVAILLLDHTRVALFVLAEIIAAAVWPVARSAVLFRGMLRFTE